ncbi:MAG: DUF2804 domain-containing protein [Spirochaetes bacterium]|nr:DUF2804 domain-containing protein [Spirochaetota bacterium]
MADYSKYISQTRQSVPTPKSLVENGQAVFGTFDREFERMELLDCKKPLGRFFPGFLRKYRITLWEATEVHLGNGVLIAALCDMGLFGMILHIFYDKRKKRVYSWSTNLASSRMRIAPNLLHGNIAGALTRVSHINYINNFQDGRCSLSGSHFDRKNRIEYDFDLERVSLPSVVSIPFGPNKPLYTQKDLFRAKGRLTFNGEFFESDDQSTAIVDDHRGYYPYRAHYDWLTTMGRRVNGRKQYFAFNLTRNQSIDQEQYNENLIWLEKKTSLLPPVTFERNAEDTVWTARDEHDMVNVSFDVGDMYRMELHAGLVDIDYHVAFGELQGYLRGTDGTKFVLDGMTGMGEDKSLRL